MTTLVLSADAVKTIYHDCMLEEGTRDKFPDADVPFVDIRGITWDVRFFANKLTEHKENIEALLRELPSFFMQKRGEKLHVANLDNYGNVWTQSYRVIEELVLLGMAIGKVQLKHLDESFEDSIIIINL